MSAKNSTRRRRGAKLRKSAAVLRIGFHHCFSFDDPTNAAKAFALLSSALRCRQRTIIGKDGGPEHVYEPSDEMLDMQVIHEPHSSLRLS